MGTITARKRKDGITAHLTQVLIQRGGTILHREAGAFGRKEAAATWVERPEKGPTAPRGTRSGKVYRPRSPTSSRWFSESIKEIGQTKARVLDAIKGYEIAQRRCSRIGSTDLVDFANRLATEVEPQTVSNVLLADETRSHQ